MSVTCMRGKESFTPPPLSIVDIYIEIFQYFFNSLEVTKIDRWLCFMLLVGAAIFRKTTEYGDISIFESIFRRS